MYSRTTLRLGKKYFLSRIVNFLSSMYVLYFLSIYLFVSIFIVVSSIILANHFNDKWMNEINENEVP